MLPAWAQRASQDTAGEKGGLREREEVRGPPVELGKEEREHVAELRGWWCEMGKDGESSNE